MSQPICGHDHRFGPGYARIIGSAVNESNITFATFPGAERFGYQIRTSTGIPALESRILTVLKATSFTAPGYYQYRDLHDRITKFGRIHGGTLSTVMKAGAGHLQFIGQDANGYIEFPVTVQEGGTYQIDTSFMSGGSFLGGCQLSIDGQPLGPAFNSTFFALIPTHVFSHGRIPLSSGTHMVRYQMVGAAGSEPAGFGVTSMRVVPVNTTTLGRGVQLRAARVETTAALGVRLPNISDREETLDIILFRKSAAGYSAAGLSSDAACVHVTRSGSSGIPQHFAMIDGVRLEDNGRTLLSATTPTNIAVSHDEETAVTTVHAQVQQDGTTIHLATRQPSKITVNGTQLMRDSYSFDRRHGILELKLPTRQSTIEIRHS